MATTKKTNSAKVAKKATKRLQKAKKLQETKPLFSWGASNR
jgi:hypothetical protein